MMIENQEEFIREQKMTQERADALQKAINAIVAMDRAVIKITVAKKLSLTLAKDYTADLIQLLSVLRTAGIDLQGIRDITTQVERWHTVMMHAAGEDRNFNARLIGERGPWEPPANDGGITPL
jgi:hypothetical protein